MLFGNLETGEFGDSRVARRVIVRLAVRELALGSEARCLDLIDGSGLEIVELHATADGVYLEFDITLPPEAGAVYQVKTSDDAEANTSRGD